MIWILIIWHRNYCISLYSWSMSSPSFVFLKSLCLKIKVWMSCMKSEALKNQSANIKRSIAECEIQVSTAAHICYSFFFLFITFVLFFSHKRTKINNPDSANGISNIFVFRSFHILFMFWMMWVLIFFRKLLTLVTEIRKPINST